MYFALLVHADEEHMPGAAQEEMGEVAAGVEAFDRELVGVDRRGAVQTF